jgi:hypothetical protein
MKPVDIICQTTLFDQQTIDYADENAQNRQKIKSASPIALADWINGIMPIQTIWKYEKGN